MLNESLKFPLYALFYTLYPILRPADTDGSVYTSETARDKCLIKGKPPKIALLGYHRTPRRSRKCEANALKVSFHERSRKDR